MDPATGAQQIGERERERALARSELEPRVAGRDRVADQRDVVVVVYLGMSARDRLRA